MTKQDYMDELKRAKAEAEASESDPFHRGEAIALDYALDLAKDIRNHVSYVYSKNVNLSFTMEQAKYLTTLLGEGPLDALILKKIERGMTATWKR